MNLLKCLMTNSTWYKGAVRNSRPVGILWHDTAGGNPALKRYVQPYETDTSYQEMMSLLGKNKYGNDWNHINHKAGLNAWIGKLANGSVATIQTGEWEMTPWGCGAGKNGSCNGYIGDYVWQGMHWIQFEICDDGYGNREYFEKVYKEACELTAYLCKKFNIDPNGTVKFNGVNIPTILCHADSYKLGVGNNHGDVYLWFNRYGYTMDSVRKDVSKLLNVSTTATPEPVFNNLDVVRIKEGVTTYSNGATIPSWVRNSNLYVRGVKNNVVTISTLTAGDITGVVYVQDLVLIEKYQEEASDSFSSESSSNDQVDDSNVIDQEELTPSEPHTNVNNDYVECPDINNDTEEIIPPIIEDTIPKDSVIEDIVPPENIDSDDASSDSIVEEDLISEEDKITLSKKFSDLISFIISLIIKSFKK